MLSNTLAASVGIAAICVQSEIYRIKNAVGGPRLPDSPSCWLEICAFGGIRPCGQIMDGDAYILHHDGAGWVLMFDRTAPLPVQCRMLAHEFAEYLLATMEPPDAPCPPIPPGVTLREWRHLVSEEVVRLFWPS